jgi:hypothetical protein
LKFLSKQNIKTAAFKYTPLLLGLRVPGFVRIHFRYMRTSLITWFVLFIAPFVMGVVSLSIICEKILEVQAGRIQLFLISLFIIALAFFFAERNRKFRRIYVIAIPTMVVANGLFHLFFIDMFSFGSLVKFVILAALPAWWLGRHATGKGYRLLSNGADKDYRPGRDLYVDGQYEAAFIRLELAARRGHMKSLYLLGDAHEHGKGREKDRIKAAKFYDKAGRKGYGKANRAFETLFASFSPEEKDAYEAVLADVTVSELL